MHLNIKGGQRVGKEIHQKKWFSQGGETIKNLIFSMWFSIFSDFINKHITSIFYFIYVSNTRMYSVNN